MTNLKTKAVVLGLGITGLACVRLLSKKDILVYGVSLFKDDEGITSSRCKHINLWHLNEDYDKIADWLEDFVREFSDPPVVFPTSDLFALMLAKRFDRLKGICRIWENSLEGLNKIISKNHLYNIAEEAGVPIPPSMISPQYEMLDAWIKKTTGPFLIKPYYVGTGVLDSKNKSFNSSKELLNFVKSRHNGTSGLIIQRILRGGDGRIYDCYGITDKSGKVRTMASHRRIVQVPPDFGVTCFGEIPAEPPVIGEKGLFDLTQKLLNSINYHGIFGIEWLYEKDSDNLFLLDFNARPFLTIGHLGDCGLNLPYWAYLDLCGNALEDLQLVPKPQKKYWLAFWSYLSAIQKKQKSNKKWKEFFSAIFRSRSFAIWSINDPMPACWKFINIIPIILRKLFSNNRL